jgi:rhodanese-related sulfurtransferase
MKNIFVLLVLFSTIACSGSGPAEETSYLINPVEFKEMMANQDIIVLDVRTPGEVSEGVIGTPLIINYQDDNFKEKISGLDKSKTYMVYCKGGGRSGNTKSLMDKSGFNNVYDLDGGITAWKSAGFLTE